MDANASDSQANQDMVTITQTDTDIFVEVADGETLNEFELLSGDVQETGKWIAIAIETGDTDITKVTLDGVAFDEDDVLLATSMGAPAGSFILWVDADALPKTFILGGEGKESKTFTITLI